MSSTTRRRLLKLGGVAAAAAVTGSPLSLLASTKAATPKSFRIFMVLGRGEGANEAGFKDALARRGIKAEYTVRNTGGDASKLPGIVDEIRAMRPHLIYAWGTPQTLGLVGEYDKNDPRFIRDIPVIFTFVAEPVDAKIVRSLEQPGGNTTGTIHIAPISSQIKTILAYRPVQRLGVVFNPAERNSALAVERFRGEWTRLGKQLIEVPAPLTDGKPNAADIPALIERCKKQGAEMLYIGPDTFIASINRKVFAEAALALKMPTFAVSEPIVRNDGGLFSLSSSNYGIGRLTGLKAAQILLEGKKPGELPVERLRSLSVVINIGTAKTLAYYPPIGLLNFAEVVGT